MQDPRTKAYLAELAKAIEQNRKANDAAQEICTCANCIESRMKKEMSACEMNKLNIAKNLSLQDKIIKRYPSNFFPQLSPDYERFF